MAKRRFPVWLIAVLLALVTLALYWPATRCDFVNHDDDRYVTENVQVQRGLNWETIKWGWLNPVVATWHPLTVWSHALDCQLFGLKPWGHHLTSVVLHAVNTVLVFLLLRGLTGAVGRSVLVAALFGWHPLHVESATWIAERKDVLSGCFGLLALMAYVRFAECRMQNAECRMQKPEPEVGGQSPVIGGRWSLSRLPSSIFYLLSLFLFALGLMSKPMLVTWPFVMLLLDYWPLRRMQNAKDPDTQHATRNTQHASALTAQSPIANRKSQILFPLLFEKLPFFALAAAASVVTFIAQQRGGALTLGESLPLAARAGNALILYCLYLGKLFWPMDMTVFYPHPGQWPLGMVILAGALMLGVSALAWVGRRRHPCLLMGWLWYCGTLVPVIQLVQTGGHAMADRYTYLPSLGVLILAVWGAYELVEGKGEGRRQNEECRTPNAEDRSAQLYSPIANRQGRSSALPPDREPSPARSSGKHEREIKAVPRSVQVPTCCEPGTARGPSLGHLNPWWKCRNAPNRKSQIFLLVAGGTAVVLCLALARQQIGYWKDSESLFRHALEVTADNYLAHNNLGAAVQKKGQTDEAIRHYQEALRLKPDYPDACYNLATALVAKGQMDDAIHELEQALRFKPDYPNAQNNLGAALVTQGHLDEGISHYQEAIRLKPDHVEAHYNLGAAFDGKGQTDEAIAQFQVALRLKPDYAEAHYSLGNDLGKKGQFTEAISQFQAALRLRPDYAQAHFKLGKALGIKGQTAEAISELQEALRLKPDYPEARNNLAYLAAAQSPQALAAMGATLAGQGNYAEAIRSYQAALKAQPDQAGSLNNLAWLLATCPDATFRNGPEAVKLATRACDLTGHAQPLLMGTLAAAQAEAGDFPAAIATAERAAALATTLHLEEVAARNRELILLYRQGQPYHEKRDENSTTDGHR